MIPDKLKKLRDKLSVPSKPMSDYGPYQGIIETQIETYKLGFDAACAELLPVIRAQQVVLDEIFDEFGLTELHIRALAKAKEILE